MTDNNLTGMRKYNLSKMAIRYSMLFPVIYVAGEAIPGFEWGSFPWVIFIGGFFGVIGVAFGAYTLGDHSAFKRGNNAPES